MWNQGASDLSGASNHLRQLQVMNYLQNFSFHSTTLANTADKPMWSQGFPFLWTTFQRSTFVTHGEKADLSRQCKFRLLKQFPWSVTVPSVSLHYFKPVNWDNLLGKSNVRKPATLWYRVCPGNSSALFEPPFMTAVNDCRRFRVHKLKLVKTMSH